MPHSVRHVLRRALAKLGILSVVLLALAYPATAFTEGDIRHGTFVGCDTIEDARAFFGNIEKASAAAGTCGTIRNAVSVYVKEIESISVEGGKVTIHLVSVLTPELPDQYVATFTKMEDM